MKVLYVTTEASSFASSGGLGDVLDALPKAVTERGVECKVIMPLYRTMKEPYKSNLEKLTNLSFKLSWRSTGCSVYKLVKDGVEFLFVENNYYFDRASLYGEYDDGERFAFFCTAVLEYMLQTRDIPDVLHANDWQGAMSIVYLKTSYYKYECLRNIKTVYTIHNIEYQGKYDRFILGDVFGLDLKYMNVLEFDGCLNLMKGAIVASDYVTTVSPNYSAELTHNFFAFGLADIIGANRGKISGIINGIDYSVYSPENGNNLVKAYSVKNYKTGKKENKKAILEEVGLEYNKERPLIVMITRLASQKGVDLVLHIIDELLCEPVDMILLGTGEKRFEEAFEAVGYRHLNFKPLLKFDRALSTKLYAAADFFLMPSKSEPCGLAQMIACSYGAVPIVRSVGGLYDTIIPYGCEGANGFRFDNYNAHELLFTVKNALELYKDSKSFDKLVKSAMNSKFTWDNSAEEYIQIYKNLTDF